MHVHVVPPVGMKRGTEGGPFQAVTHPCCNPTRGRVSCRVPQFKPMQPNRAQGPLGECFKGTDCDPAPSMQGHDPVRDLTDAFLEIHRAQAHTSHNQAVPHDGPVSAPLLTPTLSPADNPCGRLCPNQCGFVAVDPGTQRQPVSCDYRLG
jgi:hypothetical protein